MATEFSADGYLVRGKPIGPRMGLALWCAAVEIEGRAEQEPASIAEGLPPAARPFAENDKWMRQLGEAFRLVRQRLAGGVFPLARCTGEEFALHTIISAAAALDVRGLGPDSSEFGMQFMPEPRDTDFVAAHRDLFEDSDLLLLFDPILDGIDDPDSEVNQRFGIGPYLHPANWFDEFPGYAGADPLEPVDVPAYVPELMDEDVIRAAADLAHRSGARTFGITHLAGGGWTARAGYRGVDLTANASDPDEAATALVRRIIEDAVCPPCGRKVTVDPGEADLNDGRCHWQRVGAEWQRGCA